MINNFAFDINNITIQKLNNDFDFINNIFQNQKDVLRTEIEKRFIFREYADFTQFYYGFKDALHTPELVNYIKLYYQILINKVAKIKNRILFIMNHENTEQKVTGFFDSQDFYNNNILLLMKILQI